MEDGEEVSFAKGWEGADGVVVLLIDEDIVKMLREWEEQRPRCCRREGVVANRRHECGLSRDGDGDRKTERVVMVAGRRHKRCGSGCDVAAMTKAGSRRR